MINLKTFEKHAIKSKRAGIPYKITEGFSKCSTCKGENIPTKMFGHGHEIWGFCKYCGSWLWIV